MPTSLWGIGSIFVGWSALWGWVSAAQPWGCNEGRACSYLETQNFTGLLETLDWRVDVQHTTPPRPPMLAFFRIFWVLRERDASWACLFLSSVKVTAYCEQLAVAPRPMPVNVQQTHIFLSCLVRDPWETLISQTNIGLQMSVKRNTQQASIDLHNWVSLICWYQGTVIIKSNQAVPKWTV